MIGDTMFSRINQRIIYNGNTKDVWFVLESNHKSLEDIHKTIVRDDRLFGVRIDTQQVSRNKRKVIDEQEVSLLGSTIVSVYEMVDDLVDEDGVELWTMPEDEVA
jgi:hypothetical protein